MDTAHAAVRRLASITLALIALGASGLVALLGVVNGVLGCDDSCSIRGGDWAENRDAWQWNAVVFLSIGLLLAAVVLMIGVAKATTTSGGIVALAGLLSQAAALAVMWKIMSASARHESLTDLLTWLSLAILATGAISILLRTRSWRRRRS